MIESPLTWLKQTGYLLTFPVDQDGQTVLWIWFFSFPCWSFPLGWHDSYRLSLGWEHDLIKMAVGGSRDYSLTGWIQWEIIASIFVLTLLGRDLAWTLGGLSLRPTQNHSLRSAECSEATPLLPSEIHPLQCPPLPSFNAARTLRL